MKRLLHRGTSNIPTFQYISSITKKVILRQISMTFFHPLALLVFSQAARTGNIMIFDHGITLVFQASCPGNLC